MENEVVLQAAIEKARQCTQIDLAPIQESWSENQKVLAANQGQMEELVKAIASGNVQGALWQILNEKATGLHLERERLLIEQRRLKEQLTPLSENFDASGIEALLRDFSTLARYAEPEEIQRLLHLTIRRIEWKMQDNIKMQFYHLPRKNGQKTNCPPAQGAGGQWLYTDVCNDIP